MKILPRVPVSSLTTNFLKLADALCKLNQLKKRSQISFLFNKINKFGSSLFGSLKFVNFNSACLFIFDYPPTSNHASFAIFLSRQTIDIDDFLKTP